MYEERKINILNKLNHDHITSVQDLSKLLNVSPATIRRDLATMEKSGLLSRTHGGAILNEEIADSLNYDQKRTKNYDLKIKIARFAAQMIQDGDVVSINSSTITSLMPQFIEAKNIIIVTNSINVAQGLKYHEDCNLILLGGTYMRKPESIEGATTVAQIKTMRFNKAFLGANGIDLSFGFSTASELEMSSKVAIIEQTKDVFFVCEHTKFDHCSVHHICDLSKVKALITDDQINIEKKKKYDTSIQIYMAR